MTFLFFAFLIITAVALTTIPKTPPPQETGLDDLGVPTASPGRPIPIVFGTVLLKSPNVVWYGHLRKEKVYAD